MIELFLLRLTEYEEEKMKILELKDVNKDYDIESKEKFTALSNISVSFDKGELVSIVGESGSGKSTLMNLIGGLDSSYTGTINISGHNLKDFKDKELDDYRKKKIGFVFQSFNLIPHLSVLDNVTIGLTLSNEKESVKNHKAIELLTKLGLKNHLKKKPTQLSGGQKQRVAIARALINDPDIILADEPTGALDSGTSQQILEILKEIADNGKLVIMVTHSEKVASVSSRIVEISDGKIISDTKNNKYEKHITKILLKNKSSVYGNKFIPSKETYTFAEVKNIQTKSKKSKGHLSFLSAVKLSIHNMWASKIKNLLMAIGVSISLISMILMLSFGSGLTGYISDQAAEYSNPTIVTLSKSGRDRNGNKIHNSGEIDSQTILSGAFTDQEIQEVSNDINNHIKDKTDFQIIYDQENENKNLSYGFSVPAFTMGSISYIPAEPDENGEIKEISTKLLYLYTTPPYYTENKLLTDNGHISKENEIMLSPAAAEFFEIEDLEECVGKEVFLNITFDTYHLRMPVKVSAIIDVSVFSNSMIMYIDYDFLDASIKAAQEDKGEEASGLVPTLLFIETGNEKIKTMIEDYVKENRNDLSGSVEEQLVEMFSEMLNTFSIALTVIAGISLIVAMIMILVVLYMSVSERTKEIGVLKSIGARKKDIKLIFSTESFLVGILSGIAGIIFTLIIGGILTLIFNSILGFAPIRMMWYYFFEALALSIVISILAGLYPSSKAAKLDPVESLRRE